MKKIEEKRKEKKEEKVEYMRNYYLAHKTNWGF